MVKKNYRLAKLLDQGHGLPLQPPLKPITPQSTGTNQTHFPPATQKPSIILSDSYPTPQSLPSARTGAEELDELVCGHIEEGIQIDPSETKLFECSLLRHSCRRHIRFNVSLKRNTQRQGR